MRKGNRSRLTTGCVLDLTGKSIVVNGYTKNMLVVIKVLKMKKTRRFRQTIYAGWHLPLHFLLLFICVVLF